MTIDYLYNEQIDRQRWDACVKNSPANLIYGHAVYLDHMADAWDAVVVNDYEAVMPLPCRKKMFISYIYHPAFVQQLGLFSQNESIQPADVLVAVHAHFKYADLFFNFANTIAGGKVQTNFTLDLSRPYEAIASAYKTDLKKNLAKTKKEDWQYSALIQAEEAITMYRQQYAGLLKEVTVADYNNFSALCNKLLAEKMVFTRAVIDKQNNILAIALFLFDGKRLYNMMNTTTPEGKNKEANHFLLDAVIKEFAGRNYIFDFEGSDNSGIKAFYEKFRPQAEPYTYYHYNHLPALVKFFKK